MSTARESLVAELIDLGQRSCGVDWDAVRAAVARRLAPTRPIPADLMDPWRSPSYWCVPVLVGDYLQADPEAIIEDLERYVCGCLVRHFYFETPRPFALPVDDELAGMIGRAYDACRVGVGTFDDRFAAKCQTWTVVLAFGTQAIGAQVSEHDDYRQALSAIVSVYSCTQLLDDWHDRADDAARGHWNPWTDEPAGLVWRVVEPLLAGARRSVAELRQHLLRDALTAQLHDTTDELTDLAALMSRASAGRPRSAVESGIAFLTERLGAAAPGLWRDFARPEVSVGSTECISAFIATLLAPIPAARPIARAVASTLLAHARPSGGWGYREDVIEDVDSTAWVLLAAVAAGVVATPGLITRSQDYLLAHRQSDGGFATYSPGERAHLTAADIPEWSCSETTVTCSAVLALAATHHKDAQLARSACDFIASRRTENGWPSYWWRGPAYGTWLAVWALTEVGGGRYQAELAAARAHLIATRNRDGGWGEHNASNAFDTALAVCTLQRLAHPDDRDLIQQSASALAGWQHQAGCWPGGAQMLAPGVNRGRDLVLRDELVTTACALSALHAAAASGQSWVGVAGMPRPGRSTCGT